MRTEASDRDQIAVSAASPRVRPFFARLPRYAYAGVALNGVAWIASWSHQGGGFVFFPLWLGFILLLDGLNVQFYFGGTSLLIVVGVAMDTVNQIEAQLIMRHYEGFTPRAGRIRGRRSTF